MIKSNGQLNAFSYNCQCNWQLEVKIYSKIHVVEVVCSIVFYLLADGNGVMVSNGVMVMVVSSSESENTVILIY